jgi:hypothetical protein
MMVTKQKWWQAMRTALARDVAVAMAIKIVLLAALFVLFARPAFRPASDAAATAAAVAGPVGIGEVHR